MASTSEEKKKLVLISSDNEEPEATALLSETVGSAAKGIRLRKADSKVLEFCRRRLVLEFCKRDAAADTNPNETSKQFIDSQGYDHEEPYNLDDLDVDDDSGINPDEDPSSVIDWDNDWNPYEDPYNYAGNVLLHKKLTLLKKFNNLIEKQNKEEILDDDDDHDMDNMRQELMRFKSIHSELLRIFSEYERIGRNTCITVAHAKSIKDVEAYGDDDDVYDYSTHVDKEEAILKLFCVLSQCEFASLVNEDEFDNLVESLLTKAKDRQTFTLCLMESKSNAKEKELSKMRLNLNSAAVESSVDRLGKQFLKLKSYNNLMEKVSLEYKEHCDKLVYPLCIHVSRLDKQKFYRYTPPPEVMAGNPPVDMRVIKLVSREYLRFPKIHAVFVATLQHYALLGRAAADAMTRLSLQNFTKSRLLLQNFGS